VIILNSNSFIRLSFRDDNDTTSGTFIFTPYTVVLCFRLLVRKILHQQDFLLPVAREIRRRGGEVIFFLTAADYPFERDLRKRGETYRFLTEYMTEEVKERMDATYWQVADEWLGRVFTWHGFSFWSLNRTLRLSPRRGSSGTGSTLPITHSRGVKFPKATWDSSSSQ